MEKYELTFPEKNIWLVENFFESKLVNIISGSLIIKKDFELSKAEKTVNRFVELNDGMRLRICVENSIPKQYVVPFVPFEADKINVEGKSEQEIDKIKEEYISTAFDVIERPLFSYLLIDRGNGVGEIFLKAHHLICDAWSVSKMCTSLCNIYEAILKDEQFESSSASYIDFVKAEQEYLNSERYLKDGDFWREYLKGMTDVVGLKDDAITNSTNAKRYTVKLDDEFQCLIDEYCKQNRFSPYILFLTALAIYIERVKEKSDFAIGTPVLNRANFKEKNMIGMFVSTMPVRFNVDEQDTFGDMCKKLAADSMTLFRHQKYPYSKISEVYKDINGVADNMYKVMLSYQNARSELVDASKYELTWRFSGNIQNELEMHIEDLNDSGNLDVHFDYLTSLFQDTEIEYLAQRIITIIKDGIINNRTIETIEIMSTEEKNRILGEFNNTKKAYPQDKTAMDLFEEQVKIRPNKTALIFEGTSVTYIELENRINQIATKIIEKGVKKGDTITLMLNRGFDMIATMFAAMKLGVCYVPIDTEFPEDRIKYILEDCGSKLLVTNVDKFNNECDTVYLELDEQVQARDIKNNSSMEDNIYMIYTSGSTGKPKGVVIKQKNVVNLLYAAIDAVELGSEDMYCSLSTYSFDISVLENMLSLCFGHTLVIANEKEQKDPIELRNLIKTNKCEVFFMTPTRMQILLSGAENIDCLESARCIMLGGEAFPKNIYERLSQNPNIRIYDGYGPTEITVWSSVKRILDANNINIGKPLNNMTAYILDSKNRLLPILAEGELSVGGAGVAQGYYNREQLTKEKFVMFGEERVYKTGDLAKINLTGECEFLGRIDSQVKLHGLRIELEEIEREINSCSGIAQSAVIVDSNERLVAYYTANKTLDEKRIKNKLMSRLPKYMIPQHFMQVDKFEINSLGKINKKILPKIEIKRNITKRPTNELQARIEKVVCEILNLDSVGIDEDFTDLGMDSLKAIEFITKLSTVDINIAYMDIFKNSTIEKLDALINTSKVEGRLVKVDKQIEHVISTNKITDKELEVKEVGNVLLTGSTGFLGSHLLANLLDSTDSTVYCLVRPLKNISAEERLKQVMTSYFEDKYSEQFGTRIIVVEGDISLAFLTKKPENRILLANNINTVIHSAANVKHFGDDEIFAKVNIDGTKNIVDFCMEYNKKLIHISTLSVSGNILEGGHIKQEKITDIIEYDETKLNVGQNLENVYAYSKFKAEEYIISKIIEGLDAKIMRLGNLTGRFADGKFQINLEENAFVGRIKAVIEMGIVPKNLEQFDVEFSPVDKIAEAIVLLSKVNNKEYNVFNVYNINHMRLIEFIDILNSINYNIHIIEEKEFASTVQQIKTSRSSNIINGIAIDLDDNNNLEYTTNIKIKADFSLNILKKLGFEWPKIDKEYILKFIKELQKQQLIKEGDTNED